MAIWIPFNRMYSAIIRKPPGQTPLSAALLLWFCAGMTCGTFGADEKPAVGSGGEGLVAYWKLQGDCRDHSGNGNHGINHGVNLETSTFNGRDAYVEVPTKDSLQFGKNNFSICAWVYTSDEVDDVIGDVVSKYDSSRRRGFTLNLKSSSGGYQSSGDDRHVYSIKASCTRPLPTRRKKRTGATSTVTTAERTGSTAGA